MNTTATSEGANYLESQGLFKQPEWTKLSNIHAVLACQTSIFIFVTSGSIPHCQVLENWVSISGAVLLNFSKTFKLTLKPFCNKHKDSLFKIKKRCIIIAHYSFTFVRRICCRQCYLKCLHTTERCM